MNSTIYHVFQGFPQKQDNAKLTTYLKDRGMEDVRYLYHATSTDNFDKIVSKEAANFKGYMEDRLARKPLARYEHGGVWFCASPFKGGLPTQSPYGEKLIAVPIDTIIQKYGSPQLYLECLHHFFTDVQYVRLIWLHSNYPPPHGCIPIDDPYNNRYLSLKDPHQTVKCFVHNKPRVYVEVFIPGDLTFARDQPSDIQIKNVTEKYEASEHAENGLLPEIKRSCFRSSKNKN